MTGYGDDVLSDDRIAAMSPAQRRDLIERLQRPRDEVFPPPIARRMRRNRLTLMTGGAIGLIPWIVYLSLSLPGCGFSTPGRRHGACRWCRKAGQL